MQLLRPTSEVRRRRRRPFFPFLNTMDAAVGGGVAVRRGRGASSSRVLADGAQITRRT